jgi:hypothetical protein
MDMGNLSYSHIYISSSLDPPSFLLYINEYIYSVATEEEMFSISAKYALSEYTLDYAGS